MQIHTDNLLMFMSMMEKRGWSMTFVHTSTFERFKITPPEGCTLTFHDPRVALYEVRQYFASPENSAFFTTDCSNEEWADWAEHEIYFEFATGGDA